jgi:hypothetical protein
LPAGVKQLLWWFSQPVALLICDAVARMLSPHPNAEIDAKGNAMTDAELQVEEEAVAREHAELRAEHARLEHEPSDTPRFIEHSRALRRHVDRQWALIVAWRARTRE